MAATIPTREPEEIQAGDTLKFTITLADYPADDGWTLTYRLTSATAQIAAFAASADGSSHAVSVAATTTADWAAGLYELRGQVEKSGEKYTTHVSNVQVLADLMADNASGNDQRTHARKALSNVETAIEALASGTNQTFVINGESYSRKDLEQLTRVRDRYRQEVANEEALERINNGKGTKGVFRIHFR